LEIDAVSRIRAVGLLSGGLDSTLAAKVMLEMGIEVLAVNFSSPFCRCTPKGFGCPAAVRATKMLGGIPLQRFFLDEEYLRMVVSPMHGYGRAMNPCIDCRIMKMRRAAQYMSEVGASFLFSGEVVGQRPMTQFRHTLELIDRCAGVTGIVLRPLSARLLPPTLPEERGWVDRERLLAIQGRSRRPQIGLAHELGIRDYPCPAGGCLLTDIHFANRLREHLRFAMSLTLREARLLALGRHRRLANGVKVIVARNEGEGYALTALAAAHEWLLQPLNFSGPVVLSDGCEVSPALAALREFTRKTLPSDARVEIRHRGEITIVDLTPTQAPSQLQPQSSPV
jgi:tRNA-specific 2-thiouridylase